MDGETEGLLIALAILALVAWGGVGRGSLAEAVRAPVWPEE
jgi:hypothetical protein